MTQIPDWLNSIHPGWHDLLLGLHSNLIAIAPDYGTSQVKEKFGGLRVYLATPEPKAIRDLISAAESASYMTCEICGQPGEPRRPKGRPMGWVKTVCESCWT